MKIKTAALLLLLAVCLFACSCSDESDSQSASASYPEPGEITELTASEPLDILPIAEPVIVINNEVSDNSVPADSTVKIEAPDVSTEAENEAEAPAEPEMKPYVAVDGITLTTYDVSVDVGSKIMPIVTMSPADATDKGEIWVSSDTAVATVNRYGSIKGVGVGSCTVTVTSTDNSEIFAEVKVTVTEKPAPAAGSECTYIDGILIANKTYPLPKDYAPGWDPVASEALNVMFAAAKEDGLSLWVCSGYRSYIDQKIIYNGYVARDGQEAADRYSARPGHSEHQTGLAFDINTTESSFANTPEAKWLAENCYKYGFIVRYPKEKEHITGYMYEPWHVRYLGNEKAKEVYDSGLCLEEFLGITSVYSY